MITLEAMAGPKSIHMPNLQIGPYSAFTGPSPQTPTNATRDNVEIPITVTMVAKIYTTTLKSTFFLQCPLRHDSIPHPFDFLHFLDDITQKLKLKKGRTSHPTRIHSKEAQLNIVPILL